MNSIESRSFYKHEGLKCKALETCLMKLIVPGISHFDKTIITNDKIVGIKTFLFIGSFEFTEGSLHFGSEFYVHVLFIIKFRKFALSNLLELIMW